MNSRESPQSIFFAVKKIGSFRQKISGLGKPILILAKFIRLRKQVMQQCSTVERFLALSKDMSRDRRRNKGRVDLKIAGRLFGVPF